MYNIRLFSLLHVAVLLSTWFCAVGNLPAQNMDHQEILDQLGSEDYVTRQQMTRTLLLDQTLTRQDFSQLITASTSQEQRHRLLAVAMHHTLRQIAEQEFPDDGGGALGVSHRPVSSQSTPSDLQAAILVADTIPGFPAHAHLEVGDLILSVDGQPLPEKILAEQFKNLIQHRKNGDTIVLSIDRAGHRTQVSFVMSSAEALSKMYGGNPISLLHPYVARWQVVRDELIKHAPPVKTLFVPAVETEHTDQSPATTTTE